MRTPLLIHVVADSAARQEWGAAVATGLGSPRRPANVITHRLAGRGGAPRASAAAADVRRVPVTELIADLADAPADLVVLATAGSTVEALLHALAGVWSHRRDRPAVVTGFPGSAAVPSGDSLVRRAGADLVLVHTAAEERGLKRRCLELGLDPSTIVRTALPLHGGSSWDPGAAGRDRPYTICLVTQPSVPPRRAERRELLERAIRHAWQHPEQLILVKHDAPGGHHLDTALLPGDASPANLQFVPDAIPDVLDRTDLCVTISSLALLEAMQRAIPTVVLADFGVRETLGNHVFVGSGVLLSWDAVEAGYVPNLDPGWAADNGVHDADPYAAARQRVAELVVGTLPPLGPRPPRSRPARADAGLRRRAIRAASRCIQHFGVRPA